MLDIMQSSKNAMMAFEQALRAQTSNMGNMDTVGYKTLKYSFKTIFNQVLQGGSAGDSSFGGTNPLQLGPSVALGGVNVDFSQGDIGQGSTLDAAVIGNGLFMVSPDQGKTFYYTRAGNFKLDGNGNVLDSSGRQLYGYKANDDGTTFNTASPTPMNIGSRTDIGWQANGSLGILVDNYADTDKTGKQPFLYQIALTDFPNKSGLVQHDGTTFVPTPSAGIQFNPGAPGTGIYGEVRSQAIEKSNVFFIGETVDAIEVQRAMSASLTAIKIASEQIQSVIQKIGG